MYSLVLFDLDGTSFDTSEGIYMTSSMVCREMGYEPLPPEEKYKIIGPPLKECFQIIGMTEPDADKAEKMYIQNFGGVGKLKATPYPGFEDMLKKLRNAGVRLGIASLKNQMFVRPLFEKFQMESYFETLRGSNRDQGVLTKDAVIRLCLSDCGITDPSTVLMVGDSPYDAEGAARCGCDFAAVTFGFGFRSKEDAQAVSPVCVAENNQQLCDFILGSSPSFPDKKQ